MFGLGKVLRLSIMIIRGALVIGRGKTCNYRCNLVREIVAADVRLTKDGICATVEEEIVEEGSNCDGTWSTNTRARQE